MVRHRAVHSDGSRSEVRHLQVKDASSIPMVWQAPESFSVLRLESECGMADRITKLASAPALLVSVSIKSIAIADYRLWVDDKLVSTPSIHAFRSNVVDLDANWRSRKRTSCCRN